MANSERSAYQFETARGSLRILIAIGLVSMGLLTGILLMLILDPSPQTSQPAEIRLVERIGISDELSESALAPSITAGGAFREVARSAVESVVSVSIESSWHSRLLSSSDSEMIRDGQGSGVVLTPQGHIVTNHHLIENAGKLLVLFSDKREFEAYTVGVDRSTDLAVIQIVLSPGESIQPMTIGDSETLQLGDWVLAVGNPLQLNSTVTAGIVSAVGRSMDIIDSDFGVENFIQTDAAINPGNSGGALVNLNGELIGINTAIATNSGFYEGYGFAIPVNLAIRVASDLIEFGEFRRGYLGVITTDISAKLAKVLGMETVRGVFLDRVYDGSAAERSGLRPGDVIFEINGRSVEKPNQLQSEILLQRPYSEVEIIYWRDGQVDSLNLTLLGRDHPGVASWLIEMGYRPNRQVHTARYLDQWGLVVRDQTESDAAQFGEFEGLIVQRVTHPSEIEFLQAGVLIERINGQVVRSVKEAIKQLKDADETVRLSIRDQWNTPRTVLLSVVKS